MKVSEDVKPQRLKIVSTRAKEFNFVRALVHGDSGIGKTTSLKTLPRDITLVAGAERSLLPLGESNYNAIRIDSWDDVRTMITELANGMEIDGKFIKILAVDSLSQISELCKQYIVEVDRKALVRERTGGKKDTPTGIYDDQMTIEDWGVYGTRMTNMISAACHLPMHVIFTCLSTWHEDKQSGATFRTPALQGRLATMCPAYFDLVFHMEAAKDSEGNPIRVFRTFNDGRVIAKDASGKLDPFEPSNWKSVFKKVLTLPVSEQVAKEAQDAAA